MRSILFRIGFGLVFAIAAVLAVTPVMYACPDPWEPNPNPNPLDDWEPSTNPECFMLFAPGISFGVDMALDHIGMAFQRYTYAGLRAAFDIYSVEQFGAAADIYCYENEPFGSHVSWASCANRIWDRYQRTALRDIYSPFTVEPGDNDLGDLLSQFPEVDLERPLRRSYLNEISTPVFTVPLKEGLSYEDIYALLKDMRSTPGILMAEPGIAGQWATMVGATAATNLFYVQAKADFDPIPELNEFYKVRVIKTYEDGEFFWKDESCGPVRSYLLQTTGQSTIRAASLAMYYYQDAPASIVLGLPVIGGLPYVNDGMYTLVGSGGETSWTPDPFELEPEGEPLEEGALPEEGEAPADGEPTQDGEPAEGQPEPEGVLLEGVEPEGALPEGEPLPEGSLPEGWLPEGVQPEGETPVDGESPEGMPEEGQTPPDGETVEGEPAPEGEGEPQEGEILPRDGETAEGDTVIPISAPADEGQTSNVNINVSGCFG